MNTKPMKHMTTKNKLLRAVMTLLIALLGSVAVDSNCYAGKKRISSTCTKKITGYGDSENGRYYLIASPIVDDVSPEDVTNMTTGVFDLYYFDQSAEDGLEWRNYKAEEFELVSGKGYLYANSEDVILTFTGIGKQYNEEENTFPLDYDVNSAHPGVNLIGNPFNVSVTVNCPFYVLNENGDEIEARNAMETVEPMQGFFVIAEGEGGTATLEAVSDNNSRGANFILTLRRAGGGAIDRAIVRFGESHYLPKFQLRKNSTKLFIMQDKQEFAVVSGDASCQMPVGFKAEHDGSYAISLSNSGVEFSYLHLVDKLTGKDIDLLAHPDYTFDARTTDDASRFRLDYAATNVANVQRSPFRGEQFGGTFLPQHGLQGNQDANKADDPEPDDPESQTMVIALAAGWNWFSTNNEITLDDLKAALVEALPGTNITIQSQTENATYNSRNCRWTGRLSSIDVAQMYMIQVNSDCEFTLEGMSIAPGEHPVTIAEGDNWIGFPFAQSMSVANAFAGFAVNGDVIISQTASACYSNGAWKGTLKNLEPGQGYIYKSAATEARTFTYPTGGGADSGSNDSSDGGSHWSEFYYHSYQYNRPVVAAIMIDGQYVTADDYSLGDMEVAVFVGEDCRGNRFTLTNRYVENGGEQYPVLGGMPVYYDYNGGQEVTFRLYANDVEYTDCEILYDGASLPILTGEDHVEGWMDPEKPIVLSFHSPAVDLVLSDTGSNADAIEQNNNRRANVTLQGRKLYKDGAWNTLCLPFSTELTGDLANADIRALSSASLSDGGVLTLTFTAEGVVTSITAGQPYIVKWAGSEGQYVENPVFTGVTISSTAPAADVISTDGKVQFLGTYSPAAIANGNKACLFLGDANTLYWPDADNFEVGAFRAYFKVDLGNGLGVYPAPQTVRQFVLNFDGEETGIVSLSKESGNQETVPEFLNSLDYYTLDGQCLDGQPTRKGLYIHGGRKVVIK